MNTIKPEEFRNEIKISPTRLCLQIVHKIKEELIKLTLTA